MKDSLAGRKTTNKQTYGPLLLSLYFELAWCLVTVYPVFVYINTCLSIYFKAKCAYFNTYGQGNVDERMCKQQTNLTCSTAGNQFKSSLNTRCECWYFSVKFSEMQNYCSVNKIWFTSDQYSQDLHTPLYKDYWNWWKDDLLVKIYYYGLILKWPFTYKK